MDDNVGEKNMVHGRTSNEPLMLENLHGLVFNSRDAVWEYYKEYAKNCGFSVCRSTTRYDGLGKLISHEFCCSRAGKRRASINDDHCKRTSRAITRIGCKAKIVVQYCDSVHWRISFFHNAHNHELGPPIMRPFLRSSREVTDGDLDEARTLKNVGVKTSQIINFFTQQSGVFHNVGFIRKDLYNSLHQSNATEIRDGDVNALLTYFDLKKEQDTGFYMQYDLDDSGGVALIFFGVIQHRGPTTHASMMSLHLTRRTKGNVYGRPLLPIVDVNHHHQTIVFSVAILADETVDSFEWVLRQFADAMCNKAPVLVVTDGDRAMHIAIKMVFPLACHRICSWHLSRNAQANVGDKKFTSAFTRCMSSWWTIEEFDREWRSVVKQFNVEHHPWVVEKDQPTTMRAQVYLTGHFFANLRSTQRCEAINAALNIVLTSKKTYIDVVRAIDKGINEMRIK